MAKSEKDKFDFNAGVANIATDAISSASKGVTGNYDEESEEKTETSKDIADDTETANTGLFNFQSIMDDFYSSEPEADTGQALMKSAFQGNMIQSALDSQLAQQLGQFNAGLAKGNMRTQADLEQRNQSALMRDEFAYGMSQMDAQFKYQNTFANAQHERDLGMVSATGQEERLNKKAQGVEDRLLRITEGEQQRLTDAQNNISKEKIAQGLYDSQRDVANIDKASALGVAGIRAGADTTVATTQADASKEVALTQAKATTDVAKTQLKGDKFKATAAADASKYGADKTVDVAKVNTQGTIDNTRATGDETRKTQDNEQRLKAIDRANMHKYARSTARAF